MAPDSQTENSAIWWIDSIAFWATPSHLRFARFIVKNLGFRPNPCATQSQRTCSFYFGAGGAVSFQSGEIRVLGGIEPATGIVAQQILGISNRIGKTATTATCFSNAVSMGLR
jgi:hypothetical protein